MSKSDCTIVILLIHYWSSSTVSWLNLFVAFTDIVAVIEQIWWWALVGNRQPPTSAVDVILVNFLKDWLNTIVCFEQCSVLWTSSAGRLGLVLLLPWVFRSVYHNCLIWKLLYVNLDSTLPKKTVDSAKNASSSHDDGNSLPLFVNVSLNWYPFA